MAISRSKGTRSTGARSKAGSRARGKRHDASASTRNRHSVDATHASAFVTPTGWSDFGVLLADEAIPFVAEIPLGEGGVSVSERSAQRGEQAVLSPEVVAAIALALHSSIGAETLIESAWVAAARQEATGRRF